MRLNLQGRLKTRLPLFASSAAAGFFNKMGLLSLDGVKNHWDRLRQGDQKPEQNKPPRPQNFLLQIRAPSFLPLLPLNFLDSFYSSLLDINYPHLQKKNAAFLVFF